MLLTYYKQAAAIITTTKAVRDRTHPTRRIWSGSGLGIQIISKMYLGLPSRRIHLRQNFHENMTNFSGDISQTVANALSCNVEESFEKFLDADLETDEFPKVHPKNTLEFKSVCQPAHSTVLSTVLTATKFTKLCK